MSSSENNSSSPLRLAILVLLNTMLFFTPFVFTWVNQELFEFNKMLVVYAFDIAVFLLWGLQVLLHKKLSILPSKLAPFLGIFFLSQLVSTVFSLDHRTSILGYYSRFNGGLLSLMSYLLIFFLALQSIRKKYLPLFIESLLISGFLLSLYAIPEHFGHSVSCLLISHQFDVNCWRETVQLRIFGTFGQPNWLAAYMAMLLPLNLLWFERSWQKGPSALASQIFWLVTLLSNFATILFTQSRSGLLAAAAAWLLFWGSQIVQKLLHKALQWKRIWPSFLLSSLALGVLFLFFGSIYTPSLSQLLQNKTVSQNSTLAETEKSSSIEEGGSASSEIRKVVWTGAFRIWQRYPLFGSGVETFAYSYYLDRPVEHNLLSEWNLLYNKAHNELLNYLANSGAFGLLSYLSIFVALAFFLWQAARENKLSQKSIAFASSLLAMFVSNFFGFSTVMVNLLFFLLLAFLCIENEWFDEKKKKSWQWQFKAWQQLLLGLLLSLFALFAWRWVWRTWYADYQFTAGQNAFENSDYQNALNKIQTAIELSPKEALFYDQLATDYGILATLLADQDASASAELASTAVKLSTYALTLNPHHLNFYKSQVSLYVQLGKLDPSYYLRAISTLQTAITLAPSDAKLYYNLSLLQAMTGQTNSALATMQKAVDLKSNYAQARNQLAEMLIAQGRLSEAAEQYQAILEQINPNDSLVQEKFKLLEASLSAQEKLAPSSK
jgi:putative inorganic carbon (HCO3(-)) transporter